MSIKYENSFLYKTGYQEGYEQGFAKAIKFLERQPPKIDVIINISDLDKVTETDRDLADALNTVENYKNMLFGK